MPEPADDSSASERERIERLVSRQLGRPARGLAGVAVFCPHGYPAVIETLPYLEDGTPFPTLLYLTCPSAVSRVSELEAAGGVDGFRRRIVEDETFAAVMQRLTGLYKAKRLSLLEACDFDEAHEAHEAHAGLDGGQVFLAGIGGPEEPCLASCLHAYAAAALSALGYWRESAAGLVQVEEEDEAVWAEFVDSLGKLWCAKADCRGYDSIPGRRAVIDVGTNSVRLMVADVKETGRGRPYPEPLLRIAEVTRLGEGLEEGRLLGEAAMTRTRAVVDRFVEEARHLSAERITLFGTSAARRAKDGAAFVQELGRYNRITAGVLTGDLEAALAYSGATVDATGEVVLLDVGGGSTELVRWDEAGESLLANSVEVGCVVITEREIRNDPPLADERARIRDIARRHFAPLASTFAGAETLVGVAGTVTTLACLVLGLSTYNADAVHLTMLSRDQIAEQLERLAALDLDERAALTCMQRGRADVIVAGGEIVLAAMDALGYGLILVSERDILDGVVLAVGS